MNSEEKFIELIKEKHKLCRFRQNYYDLTVGIQKYNEYLMNEIGLRIASNLGYVDIVKFLIEYGVDVKTRDNFPLRKASEKGHFEIVKMLVEAGADVLARNNEPIRLASKCEYKDNIKVIEYLHKKGARLDKKTIEIATKYHNYETIKYLHQNGVSMNGCLYVLVQPLLTNSRYLHYLIKGGYDSILEYMVENGVKINKKIEINYLSLSLKQIKLLHKNGLRMKVNESLFRVELEKQKYILMNEDLFDGREINKVSKTGYYNKLLEYFYKKCKILIECREIEIDKYINSHKYHIRPETLIVIEQGKERIKKEYNKYINLLEYYINCMNQIKYNPRLERTKTENEQKYLEFKKEICIRKDGKHTN